MFGGSLTNNGLIEWHEHATLHIILQNRNKTFAEIDNKLIEPISK